MDVSPGVEPVAFVSAMTQNSLHILFYLISQELKRQAQLLSPF
jgi:hypothetical protein